VPQPPSLEKNPHWRGNYTVEYWRPERQTIIFGRAGAYLDRML
jgi:endo-alpha-1,4-polygalactosaminidase (GH114 family)